MWEYKIVFKEKKEGGKLGVYNVKADGILTSDLMESMLLKKFPRLVDTIIVNCKMKTNRRKIAYNKKRVYA